MSDRMTDEMFAAYEIDDEAGMLLMDLESEKDKQIVEMWGWMQNERAKVDELEAKIDMLMLEWCPEEMSEEQKANWERHQVRVSPEEQAEIEKALEQL